MVRWLFGVPPWSRSKRRRSECTIDASPTILVSLLLLALPPLQALLLSILVSCYAIALVCDVVPYPSMLRATSWRLAGAVAVRCRDETLLCFVVPGRLCPAIRAPVPRTRLLAAAMIAIGVVGALLGELRALPALPLGIALAARRKVKVAQSGCGACG